MGLTLRWDLGEKDGKVGMGLGAGFVATAMNYHFTGIAGAPISLLAVILLVLYTRRYEARA